MDKSQGTKTEISDLATVTSTYNALALRLQAFGYDIPTTKTRVKSGKVSIVDTNSTGHKFRQYERDEMLAIMQTRVNLAGALVRELDAEREAVA